MLTMLLIASHLGPSSFGVYAVIMGLVNIANFVAAMGLGTLLTKFVAEAKQSVSYYVALSLPIACSFGVACGVILTVIVCAAYSVDAAGWAALAAVGNIVLFSASVVFASALRGLQQIEKWLAWFFVQKAIALVVVMAVLRPYEGGLATALTAWTVGNLVSLLFAAAALWGDAWRGQLRWSLREIRSIIGETVTVALTAATSRLAMELENFVLAILVAGPDVGLFAAGKRAVNPAGQIFDGAVSVPAFPGLCRLASENRREFSRWATQLSVIQWACGLTAGVAAYIAAPLVIPLLLEPEYNRTIEVVQITVWCLAPALLANQLRYVYIALSQQVWFLKLNVLYLALKSLVLVVLTWRYGIWGACYGAVLTELMLAVIVRVGATSMGVSIKLGWRCVAPTIATAAWMTVLWQLGDERRLAFALVAVYLVVAAYVINRLLRNVRRHMPKQTEPEGPSADGTL